MNQTHRLLAFAGIAAMTLFATPAVKADTATGNATTTILSGLTMAPVAGNFLNFGKIVQSATAGYVTIDATGARFTNISVVPNSSHSEGQFNVAGSPAVNFYIQLPASATLTRSGGKETMTINSFVAAINGRVDGIGSLDLTGAAVVHVGGTLQVGANQVVGEYDGTYAVTYAYN